MKTGFLTRFTLLWLGVYFSVYSATHCVVTLF